MTATRDRPERRGPESRGGSARDPLERAIRAIRAESESLSAQEIEGAAQRAWSRLGAQEEHAHADADAAVIHGCDGYQALMSDLVAGRLTEARRLLVEDHARSCVRCRQALDRARSGEMARTRPSPAPIAGRRDLLGRVSLRLVAAAIALAVGLTAAVVALDQLGQGAVEAHAASIDGALYRVTDTGNVPLKPGESVDAGEAIRAGRDAGGVIALGDGSRLELAARSELSLRSSPKGPIVDLARGNIIIRAAEQEDGLLRVLTDDCAVSVKGTIFVVRHGAKGSRVSVLEGEVVVAQDGEETVLTPGHQITTDPRLGSIRIQEDVAWSRDVGEYIALLTDIRDLRADLRTISPPEVRYASVLTPFVPAETVLLAAAPNVGSSLAEAHRLLEQRLAKSESLRDWWEPRSWGGPESGAAAGPTVKEIVERLDELGSYFGSEIVVAAEMSEAGAVSRPVVLAEVADPAGLRAATQAELDRMAARYGDDRSPQEGSPVSFVDESELAAAAARYSGNDAETLYVWAARGYLVAGPDPRMVEDVVGSVVAGTQKVAAEGGFYATSLGQRVSAAYDEGVAWLLAVDLGAALDSAISTNDVAREDRIFVTELGLLDADSLVATQRTTEDGGEARAELVFDGPRRGIAAWLAEPGPMGALDYISADAYVASAFVIRDPEVLLAQTLEFAAETGRGLGSDIAEAGAATEGLALIEELAASLGGEVAIALDGPVLPKPSWKVVLEVYDAPGLQQAIEDLVASWNNRPGSEEGPALELAEGRVAGRTSYALRRRDSGAELLNYVVADGYLIAAPSKALVERAIQTAEIGNSLPATSEFASRLPRDERADFSAVFYRNMEPVLGPMISGLAGSSEALTPEQEAALQELGRDLSASLAYAYAEEDRLTLASTSADISAGFELGQVLGIAGILEMASGKSPTAAP